MKRFKSLSALFLALVLALSLSVTAFAATGNNTITSITAKGEAFTITAFAYTGQMVALQTILATMSLLTLRIPSWQIWHLL